MSWASPQMRPVLCRPGRHRPVARLLYVPMFGPAVWRCTCGKCGAFWEELA